MVPKSTIQASKRGKQTIVLPSYDAYEQQQQTAWHHNPNAVAACIPGR